MSGGSNQIGVRAASSEPFPSPVYNLDGKSYFYTDTMPDTVTSSDGEYISWTGTGGTNIYGWYYLWTSTWDNAISGTGKYLVLINPLYGIDSNGTRANSALDINIQSIKNFWIYPLDTRISSNGLTGESGDTIYTGEYDEEEETWITVDEDGNVVQVGVGGGNIINTHVSINDWLQNIASQISGFFNGAIGAVNTLVQAISNFTGVLKGLYMWLPSPVLSILQSAIMLAITIGVIKVFI